MPVFGDREFDGVIDGNCFHCIIGTDRTRFLSEVRRVLRPGGIFLVSSMVGDPKQVFPELGWDPESRCQVSDGIARRYMPHPAELIAELKQGGFEILTSELRTNPWWDHMVVQTRAV